MTDKDVTDKIVTDTQRVEEAYKLLMRWAETLYWSQTSSPEKIKEMESLALHTGIFIGEHKRRW